MINEILSQNIARLASTSAKDEVKAHLLCLSMKAHYDLFRLWENDGGSQIQTN